MAGKGTKCTKATKATKAVQHTNSGKATKAVRDTNSEKATTALTREQKLDRHKRNEAIRRNQIASAWKKVMGWVPAEFKLVCNKSDAKTQSLEAAVDWLGALKAGNDELENTYKALLEAHGLISEGYLMAQTQLQEQQQQYQQQFQLPTPPSNSPPHPQPAFEADQLFNLDVNWDDPSQQMLFESLQELTPPPQLNQEHEVNVSEADANRMYDEYWNARNRTPQPYIRH